MKLEDIEKALETGGNSPHQLADMKATLAGLYGFYAGLREEITKRKPAIWNTLRKESTSIVAADRAYEMTQDGVNDKGLKMRLDRIDKATSAISSLLRMAEGESRNQY